MHKDLQTEISTIICTYNTKEMTCECLDRLKESIDVLNKPVEVIVVENGTDGTGEVIRKKYPWVKLLEPIENTGFAKGNNLGIKASNKNTKYYLFLNSDALVENDTLIKSVEYLEKNENCQVLGCRLRLENGKIQSSGGYLPTPLSILTLFWGMDILPGVGSLIKSFHPREKEFFKKDRKVGWVMGAFLFMKADVVRATKGFDESLFMYTEEVDWCRRIQDAGFNIWYTPSFEITHMDKASSKSSTEALRKIFVAETVGIIYYLKKYYPEHVWWLIPAIKIGLLTRVLAFLVVYNKNRRIAYIETLKAI